MKKLLLSILCLTFIACSSDDEKDYYGYDFTSALNGQYTITLYTIEGQCLDTDNVIFDVHNSTVYDTSASPYTVEGVALKDESLIAMVTGHEIETTSIDGTISKTEGFGGDWSSESCHGYYVGEFLRDLTDNERYYYDAL